MPKRILDSPISLKDLVGQELAVTEWFKVTQERIQQFADATLDHQWIHVDVERARRESPFKAPIAHGFLTLSLLPHFMHEAIEIKQGVRMGVNYGLNRV
ncbi:MAG TPA: MaoC family dehydratase, partial [Candidatus Angelobacter sp.]|nr:MaoC family dehydratase [Candidatus Angelobacter sp.]